MQDAVPLAILGLVLLSIPLALITATETALERASAVRIEAMASRGDKRALRIAGNIQEPRGVLGPLTLGRTLCSSAMVVLGAFAGAQGAGEAAGALAAGAIVALVVAVVQLTAGLLAAREPERASLALSGVASVVAAVLALPAALLALPARLLAGPLRVVVREHREDILAIVERDETETGVEAQEQRMIRGVIRLDEKTVREIMVPRIDIVAAELDEPLDSVAHLIAEHGFSRIPVYRERIDDVAGVVYAKDILRALNSGGRHSIADIMRKVEYVPDSKKLDELLSEMRQARIHLAIVSDEYGGVAGLVTFEDLIEEIVGEIEDEYDRAAPSQERLAEGDYLLDARAPTQVLGALFDVDVDSDDFDTVGGFLMHELGRLPSVGDRVSAKGLDLRVVQMTGRRLRRLRVRRQPPAGDAPPGNAQPAV
ncbi:MAG: hemolysin family protein [Dehalococcoidia bacterium]